MSTPTTVSTTPDCAFTFPSAEHAIRADLPDAFRSAWRHIATPGPGWSGQERVAIAEAVRHALECSLCRERKTALSPHAVDGEHAATELLPAGAVDAVHRIATDAARLTKTWYEGLLADGLTDVQYAEIIGIVSTLASIDAFCFAMGIPLEPLPAPLPGPATGYRPERLKPGGGWLAVLMENDLPPNEKDVYGGLRQGANVLRAMSLAPDEVRNLNCVGDAMYLSAAQVQNFRTNGGRAISRAHIELLASRVSAINQCFY